MLKLIVFAALVLASLAENTGNTVFSVSNVGRSLDLNAYRLFTRDNPRVPIVVAATVASVSALRITQTVDCAVVIHGHADSFDGDMAKIVKDALLQSGNINVLLVNWSIIAGQTYAVAVSGVPSVGTAVATVVRLMAQYSKVNRARLHFIGFGLGAHVAGYAGRSLAADTAGPIARITGLDPSGDLWFSNPERLRPGDASYVEVIHTEITEHGINLAIGDVDFYANDGMAQPGCTDNDCRHNRAWELFAASLTHGKLVGHWCATLTNVLTNTCSGYTINFGESVYNKYGSGIYRVNTVDVYPYTPSVSCDLLDSILESESGSGSE